VFSEAHACVLYQAAGVRLRLRWLATQKSVPGKAARLRYDLRGLHGKPAALVLADSSKNSQQADSNLNTRVFLALLLWSAHVMQCKLSCKHMCAYTHPPAIMRVSRLSTMVSPMLNQPLGVLLRPLTSS
jgi:hypothetical protein